MGAPCTHHGTGGSMIWGAPRAGERPVAWPWGVPWGHPQGTPQLPVAPRAVPPALRSCSAPPNSSPPASSWPLKKSLLRLDGPLQKSHIPWFLRVGKPPKRHNPTPVPSNLARCPQGHQQPAGSRPRAHGDFFLQEHRSCQLGKAKLPQPCVLPPSHRSQFTVPCKTFKYSIFNYSIHK